MSKQLNFTVQGSEPSPYIVTFIRTGNHLRATCTCAAGLIGQYCKHRFNLLSGEVTALVGDNGAEVKELPAMLAGSDVEEVLHELTVAENLLERAKKQASSLKKMLARLMSE